MHRSLRTLEATVESIRKDLARPNELSLERVGFLYCRPSGPNILGIDYVPLLDDEYERTDDPVCIISARPIRAVMERIYRTKEIVFHVHCHDFHGEPELSAYDLREIPKLLASFDSVVKKSHGILLLGPDRAKAWCWEKGRLVSIDVVTMGFPILKEVAHERQK